MFHERRNLAKGESRGGALIRDFKEAEILDPEGFLGTFELTFGWAAKA